jgi:chromatin assembly factor 1 subunit A
MTAVQNGVKRKMGGGDDMLGDSDDEWDNDEESNDLDGWLMDGKNEEVATPVEECKGLDVFPLPPISEGSKSKRKAGKEKEKEANTESHSAHCGLY